MADKYVVQEYNPVTRVINSEEFSKTNIDKMRVLGLIRFYGTTTIKGNRVFNYRGAPRTRKVIGKAW
jgi:hypothetical protein